MIVYRGCDVIFDHEKPKWNFWIQDPNHKNHSFSRKCEYIKETANATGIIFVGCLMNKNNIFEFVLVLIEEAVSASEKLMISEMDYSNRNKRQAGVGPPDPYALCAPSPFSQCFVIFIKFLLFYH